ncbi:MAG: hypothetical protein MI717_02455 [Spirochaetales bacterium]|nr:hypothetical protein [Spirochaetales bacterium]
MNTLTKMTLSLFLLLGLILACTPQATNSTVERANTPQPSTPAPPQQPSFQEVDATITRDGIWFRESLEGNGTRQLDLGEVVTVIGEVEQPEPENRNKDMLPIRLSDGTEGFFSAWYAIPNTIPAVMVAEAKIYSEPKATKLTKNTALPIAKIIAVSTTGSSSGFIKVSYADENGYARIDDYIKEDLVSTDSRDVDAAHLYALAMAQEEEGMRAEFLASAAELNSPVFGMMITEALGITTEDRPAEDPTKTTGVVIIDQAEVHEEPFADSPVIGYLTENSIVAIVGMTNENMPDGNIDYWYTLADGGYVLDKNIKKN